VATDGAERLDDGAARPEGEAVLADLPPELWGALLRGLRRAVESLDRTDLPPALRPFAGWRPDRLAGDRPRRAVAAALTTDRRLREAVGAALENGPVWAASETSDAGRLASLGEPGDVAAALTARGRWGDLAVLAARQADATAAHRRATAESLRASRDRSREDELRRLGGELVGARAERDAQRRRADAAEARLRRVEQERDAAVDRTAMLEQRAAALEADLAAARRDLEQRTARLRRRLGEAEGRARVDVGRVGVLAAQLESVAAALREALGGAAAAGSAGVAGSAGAAASAGVAASAGAAASAEVAGRARVAGSPGEVGGAPEAPDDGATMDVAGGGGGGPQDGGGGTAVSLPREAPPARPGRPCALPPGVRSGEPIAVQSLLRVPGIEVVLDGYNLTKDVAGRPTAPLPAQRRWLLALCGGVAARFGARLTVVFDGTDLVPPGSVHAPRGVRLCFSEGEEIADTVIVELVEELDPDQPVLVVTSDREVADQCAALGADVAPARSFLVVAGA